MNAVVIEHVKVSDLPQAWRLKLAASAEARVTVRIESETGPADAAESIELADDPLFGLWRDRDEVRDVNAYVRKQREPRFD